MRLITTHYIYIATDIKRVVSFQILNFRHIHRGVEIVSQLPDILAYFQSSCPAPHILCSLNTT